MLQGKLAVQQLIVLIFISHHYINLHLTHQVLTRVSGLESPRPILRTNLTGSFPTFQRFKLVEESFTCPFC